MEQDQLLSRKRKYKKRRTWKRGIFFLLFIFTILVFFISDRTFGFPFGQDEEVQTTNIAEEDYQPKKQDDVSHPIDETANKEENGKKEEEVDEEEPKNPNDTNGESSLGEGDNGSLKVVSKKENTDEPNDETPSLVDEKKSTNSEKYDAVTGLTPKNKGVISITHHVNAGETLYSITNRYYADQKGAEKIKSANGITDPSNDMKTGKALTIPDPDFLDKYKVQRKETLFQIAQTYYSKTNVLGYVMSLNSITKPSVDVKMGMTFTVPDPGQVYQHIVQPKETAYSIMNRYYNLSSYIGAIRQANQLSDSNDSLKAGTELVIPNFFRTSGKKNIIHKGLLVTIDKSEHLLTVTKDDKVIFQKSVATGKTEDLTPVGTYKIITKLVNPWYSPKSIPGGSPENPLGTRWLGLDVPGTGGAKYGIHGTNDPASIGKDISLGCVRMDNENVEWLFDNIPLGTTVIIQS